MGEAFRPKDGLYYRTRDLPGVHFASRSCDQCRTVHPPLANRLVRLQSGEKPLSKDGKPVIVPYFDSHVQVSAGPNKRHAEGGLSPRSAPSFFACYAFTVAAALAAPRSFALSRSRRESPRFVQMPKKSFRLSADGVAWLPLLPAEVRACLRVPVVLPRLATPK